MNQVHLRITVSIVNQTSQSDKRMSEGFVWSNPLVWINNESLLQQVCKLVPLEEETCNYLKFWDITKVQCMYVKYTWYIVINKS